MTNDSHRTVDELYRTRPRSTFARASAAGALALVAWSWWGGGFSLAALATPRSRENLARFLDELRPYPLQGRPWDAEVFRGWLVDVLGRDAGPALLQTFALSVAAIVLASLLALCSSPAGARTLARRSPFLPALAAPRPFPRLLWRALATGTRIAWLLMRAIPEYVLAFLLLILLGPSAWPAVLALALHNAGILGRLFAETMENQDPRPARALRALGATRLGIMAAHLVPVSLGRFLLFFFYRWETCVREATVLGLLGLSGIGYRILEAKAGLRWDEVALWTLLAGLLIVVGDLLSVWTRRWLRTAV